jgi:hypothetical protein
MATKKQYDNAAAKRERLLHTAVASDNSNIKEYTHTLDQYAHYDGWQVSGDSRQIIEIKVRDYSLSYLMKYGARIEQQKFNSLAEIQKKTKEAKGIDADIVYYSFTSTGYVIYLMPAHYNYDWQQKWCQKDDYSNEKELKWCCDLPKELITEYKYTTIDTTIKYE